MIVMCSLDVNLTVAALLYSEMYSAVASLGVLMPGWAGLGLWSQSPCSAAQSSVSGQSLQ